MQIKAKRIVMMTIVVVLCLSLTTVAFAAPSPSGEIGGAVDVNGNTVNIKIQPVENREQLVSQIDTAKAPGKVAWLQELTLPDGYTGGPVTVTIIVPAVKPGDKVTIGHYTGGAWEYFPAGNVSNGSVSATFSSFSPVAVIVESAVAVDDPKQEASTSKSPKTGDANLMMILAAIAVLATGGVVLTYRKLRKSER